jgi:hypothetical protein
LIRLGVTLVMRRALRSILGLVLPAMALAAVMLLRDRPWGYVLAGMLLVKATTIGLWVVAMIWFSARRGLGAPAAYTGFFVLLAVIGRVLSWRFLSAFGPRRGAAVTAAFAGDS